MATKQTQAELPQLHVLLGPMLSSGKELQKAKAEFQAAIPPTPPRRNHIICCESLPRVARRKGKRDELAQYEQLSKLEKEKTSPRTPQN